MIDVRNRIMEVAVATARSIGAAVAIGLLDGAVARACMRGAALTAGQVPHFTVEATLFIQMTFVICAMPLAAASMCSRSRVARRVAGGVGTATLLFAEANIGRDDLLSAHDLGPLRWAALMTCAGAIVAVTLFQPWLIIRAVRRSSAWRP